MNLVHEVAPEAEIVEKAKKAWIKGGGKAVAPWDERISSSRRARSSRPWA